ncbi:bpX6 domain-containing protein [Pseudomonas sp. UFMG81]|uniref:bpX6 domain-containing protein n=1 Tax=Pseudomonas sp. UFMG81 TaxID=2745936 RepID=UPI00188DEBEE|nr:bpX6 domain-containing protein [Pseudomonas sp. UFMG81]
MLEQPRFPVRRPLLSGRQAVAGLWLPAQWYSEAERNRLLIRDWQAGAAAWRFAEGDLLRWPQAQSLVCETLSGWPLVLVGQTLCSAPLEEDERVGLPFADLWLVRDASVQALRLADAAPLTPGLWLDVDTLAWCDTFDCSGAVPPPAVVELEAKRDVREILGNVVGQADAERDVVMKALREQQAAPGKPSQGAGQPLGQLPDRWRHVAWVAVAVVLSVGLTLLMHAVLSRPQALEPMQASVYSQPIGLWGELKVQLLFALLGLLALYDVIRRRRQPQGGDAARPVPTQAWGNQAPPPRREPGHTRPGPLRRWLTRLANAARLDRLYGKRQAEYLQRMLNLFEDGDLQEALRHAIPLDAGAQSARQAYGTPKRRTDLELRQRQGGGSAIGLADDVHDHLRSLYRRSFEQLDRQGKVDEAVFVLAELLNAHQEALDYLEKHQRHRQAADLALLWDMPAANIVRHLCLADDWPLALQVARRDKAFAAAVNLMQQKWPEAARRLRIEWAESLAGEGHWLEAVDVIWSLADQQARARQWLLDAEAGGAPLAAQALVKRLILLPDSLVDCEAQLLALRDDPARQAERAAAAQALLASKRQSASSKLFAGALLGPLVVDRQLAPAQLRQLAKLCDDPLLTADLPKLDLGPAGHQRLQEVEQPLQWQAPNPGAQAIVDARALPGQRHLLALGEAGVLLVDAQGQRLQHFPVPARHLVISTSGQVALAVIDRGAVQRIARLDLTRRTWQELGVLSMQHFSRHFDGRHWLVGKADEVRLVDIEQRFATVWHVDRLPGQIVDLRSDEQRECLMLASPEGKLERWTYSLPARRLQARDPVEPSQREGMRTVAGTMAELFEYRVESQASTGVSTLIAVRCGEDMRRALPEVSRLELQALDTEALEQVELHMGLQWAVVIHPTLPGGRLASFHRRSDGRCFARLQWPAQGEVRVINQGRHWLLFDGQGRLFSVDVENAWPQNLALC